MHSVLLLRRRYGPIGWNESYLFNDGDFNISVANLKNILSVYSETPLNILAYIIGEINYGGYITDEMDRKCL